MNTVTVSEKSHDALKLAGLLRASAPLPTTGRVQNVLNAVWHAPGERIEWTWTHTPNGSFISGYVLANAECTNPEGCQ